MTTKEVADRAHYLMFGVRRSRRYHMHRQRFLGRLDLLGSMGIWLLGSSAFAMLWAQGSVGLWFPALVAIIGAVKVAGQPADKAGRHARLAVEFTDLERDMLRAGGIERMTYSRLDKFLSRRVEIEAKEPPVYRVLDTICHNEEVMAGGYGEHRLRRVTWLQRLFASVLDLRAHSFSPKKQNS